MKQAQVDKLYASLKDLAGDRRLKLDEVLKLYMLNRDIEDLEQWIAEREVVAGSHELGQDFEHVTVRDVSLYLSLHLRTLQELLSLVFLQKFASFTLNFYATAFVIF